VVRVNDVVADVEVLAFETFEFQIGVDGLLG